MLIYIGLVSFCSIVSIIFTNKEWFAPISQKLLNAYAIVSSGVLNIFGQGTTSVNGTISGSGFSIAIKEGCDALAPMLLYFYSVLFFKASWRHKLKGLGIGLPVLAVINIIRICTLFLVGKYGNDVIFDIMHVDVWQVLFIIFTLIIWVQWLKRTELIPNVKA